MKLLIQRVLRGSVSVGGELVSQIGPGLVVLLGVWISCIWDSCERQWGCGKKVSLEIT